MFPLQNHSHSLASPSALRWSCGDCMTCAAVLLETRQGHTWVCCSWYCYLQPWFEHWLLHLKTLSVVRIIGQVLLCTLNVRAAGQLHDWQFSGSEHIQHHKHNSGVKMGVCIILGFVHWWTLTDGELWGFSQMLTSDSWQSLPCPFVQSLGRLMHKAGCYLLCIIHFSSLNQGCYLSCCGKAPHSLTYKADGN